jgi:hypothetical protein
MNIILWLLFIFETINWIAYIMGDIYEIRLKDAPELIKKFTQKITRSSASSTIGTVLAEAIKNNGRSFNGCKKNEKERKKIYT